jgi:O-antigen biosynthesis protein
MAQHEFPIELPRDIPMFREPRWLVPDTPAWIEHIPFAFWVINALRPRTVVELGTHYGNSYFAFAEAIDQVGLACSAYAVDTWQGDEHSGPYGEEVFAVVEEHNERHYSRFSSLVRSTFDEAVVHFGDGEIDLLHIDGHHTYDSVKHDFELWLPRLSSRGVVLFHDIEVRERDFGVSKVWGEVSETYPSFAFRHSHGLGVAGVGSDHVDAMASLFDLGPSDAALVGQVFARLGRGIGSDARSRRELEAARAAFEDERAADAEEMRRRSEEMQQEHESNRQALLNEFETTRTALARRIAALELMVQLADSRAASRYDRGLGSGGPALATEVAP